MTDEERILWSKIKNKQLKDTQFYRQKIIGNFIADFFCSKAKIIIEIDGGHHYQDENIKRDIERNRYFENLGFKVLRFSNHEVRSNLNGVLEKIFNEL